MTEKTTLWVFLAVLTLLLGLGLGASLFAIEKQVVVPIVKTEVVTVENAVETEKIVHKDYVEEGVNLFLEKLSSDSDFDKYLKCDNERYDANQISVSRVWDEQRVEIDDVSTDDLTHAKSEKVYFKIRLKYADAIVQSKCFDVFDIVVKHVEGEESTVEVD